MFIVHGTYKCKLNIKVLDGQQTNHQIYRKIFNLIFFPKNYLLKKTSKYSSFNFCHVNFELTGWQ